MLILDKARALDRLIFRATRVHLPEHLGRQVMAIAPEAAPEPSFQEFGVRVEPGTRKLQSWFASPVHARPAA